MKVQRANVTALRRFHRKPLAGRVRLLVLFETPTYAARAGADWSSGSGGQVFRHIVTGNDSGDMLKGDNARILAAGIAEQLRNAFTSQ